MVNKPQCIKCLRNKMHNTRSTPSTKKTSKRKWTPSKNPIQSRKYTISTIRRWIKIKRTKTLTNTMKKRSTDPLMFHLLKSLQCSRTSPTMSLTGLCKKWGSSITTNTIWQITIYLSSDLISLKMAQFTRANSATMLNKEEAHVGSRWAQQSLWCSSERLSLITCC